MTARTIARDAAGRFAINTDTPLDVWLRFDPADDDREDSEAEANTYRTADGGYVVHWYLTAVGLVKHSPVFTTLADARAWLTREGFEDFTS